MLKPSYAIPALPPPVNLETVSVLKALARANRALAELKGRAATIPNQGILIDTLARSQKSVLCVRLAATPWKPRR